MSAYLRCVRVLSALICSSLLWATPAAALGPAGAVQHPLTDAVPRAGATDMARFKEVPTSTNMVPSAAISATIPITGHDTVLHYNSDAGLLYVVDSEEQVTVVRGTAVARTYSLAEGSDSCTSARYCVKFADVAGTGRTYIAVPDTPATYIVGAFDGANLAGAITLPQVTAMTWNAHDDLLYLDTRTETPIRKQSTTVIQNTTVITAIDLGFWGWDGITLAPHDVNPTNGLVYRTRPGEVVVLDAGGVQARIPTTFSNGHSGEEHPTSNGTTGRTYAAGVWYDYDLRIPRPVLAVIDGLQPTAVYTFTETSRGGDIYLAAADKTSSSVYTVISRCSDSGCQYEVVEFEGDGIRSRLPLGAPNLRLLGMQPVSGDMHLLADEWPVQRVLAVRHGKVAAQMATLPDYYLNSFSTYDFAATSDRFVVVTQDANWYAARIHLFANNTLKGVIQVPGVPADIELTDTGVWATLPCGNGPACSTTATALQYYPYSYFQEYGNWIAGQVTDAGGTAKRASLKLTAMGGQVGEKYAESDPSGRFSFAGLPAGQYYINANVWQDVTEPLSGGQLITVPPGKSDLTLVAKPQAAAVEPVIFIPGVAGTFLKDGSEELWPALGMPWRKEKLSLAPGQEYAGVLATEPMRKIAVPLWQDERIYDDMYETLGANYTQYTYNPTDPHQLPGYGCNLQQGGGGTPAFFPFPYDWRKDIAAELAPRLANYIDTCVRQFHPDAKINIVAHSMGGLVARQYILQHPQHKIGKVITIGTPWLGAPKAINALLTGKFLSWVQHRLILGEHSLKELLAYYPGAHQLFPSRAYYEQMGGQPLHVTSHQGFDCKQQSTIPMSKALTFGESMTWLDCMYPNAAAGSNVQRLHTSEQDDWRTQQNTGVQYYVIYGQTVPAETIETVMHLTSNVCVGSACLPYSFTIPAITDGDGTVPLISATRVGNGQNLNGSETTLCRAPGAQQEHGEMAKSLEVLNLVLALLRGDASPCGGMRAADVQSQSAYYLTVNGADLPLVTDSQGNTGGGAGSGPLPYANLPGVSLQELDTAAYLLVLPKDQAYTVTLPLTTTAVLLKVEEGTGSQTDRSITYRDLNVRQGQELRLQFAPAAISALTLDANGDGAFETTLPPAADVSGPLASDTTPPTVTIAAEKVGTDYRVMITAQDASRVTAIRYTQDGQTYQVYTGPFVIGATGDVTITAFADDVAGNRSPTVSYLLRAGIVGPSLYLPLLRR